MTNNVRIKRVFRDGVESLSAPMPEYIARLTLANVHTDEPNTARAMIVREPVTECRQARQTSDNYGMAAMLYQAAQGAPWQAAGLLH